MWMKSEAHFLMWELFMRFRCVSDDNATENERRQATSDSKEQDYGTINDSFLIFYITFSILVAIKEHYFSFLL